MNGARKPFKISNMPDSLTSILLFISIMVFICGGGLSLVSLSMSFEIPDAIVPLIAFILIGLGFGTPYLIGAGMKSEIDYDGKHIRIKSFFKKQEIDIEHVKSITYWHEQGSGRYRVDGIVLEFTLFPDSEEPDSFEDTIELYDSLHGDDERTDIDRLIKGDHSGFPLIMLYDDIIETYPDKKAPEDKKAEEDE